MRTERTADARRYADFVASRVGGAIDQLFAREVRSPLWPSQDEGWMASGADEPGRYGLLVGGSEVAAPTPRTWASEPLVATAIVADPVTDALIASTPAGAATSGGHQSTSAAVVSGRLAGLELERVDRELAAGDASARACASRSCCGSTLRSRPSSCRLPIALWPGPSGPASLRPRCISSEGMPIASSATRQRRRRPIDKPTRP